MAGDAGELKATLSLENKQFLDAMKGVQDAVDKGTSGISAQFEAIGGTIEKIGGALASIGIGASIAKFGEECLAAANKTDKLYASFKALNGATEETQKVFEDISGLELKSMFDFEDVLGPAAKNMMMLGTSATQTAETMKAVVDAASGMKQGPEWITAVSDAIATMSSHVVASGKDIKALQKDGIDAYGALARQMGLSMDEAQEQIKKGMLTSAQVADAVTKDLADQWGGAAEKSMNSWKGASHILDESVEDAMAAVGRSIRGVLDEVAPIVKSIADGVETLAKKWETLPGPVKDVAIAIPAVVAGFVAVSGAVTAFGVALGAITFNPVILGITALVAALALIGKWTYENWPAIKAVFAEAVDYLSTVFSPLVKIWSAEWSAIKAVVGAVWDGIKAFASDIITAVGNVIGFVSGIASKIPGVSSEFSKLGAIWDEQQKKMADAAAADKQRQADQDAAAAATRNRLHEEQSAEAEALAASNRAKDAAAEAKKAKEEEAKAAKEAADSQKKYNEDVRAGYEALKTVAPDVAAQFADAMGGITDDTSKIAKAFGLAWDLMSDDQKKLATDTVNLGEAFKTLGVTSTASLQNAADAADKAFATISASGKATAQDIEDAAKKQEDAHQKLADFLNQDAIAAVHAFGMKTEEELTKSQDQWQAYADKVAEVFGTDSKQALEAQVKVIEEQRKALQASGKDLTDDELERLASLKQAVADAVDPVTRLANAFKALGVTSLQQQIDHIKTLAQEMAKAEQITGKTAETDIDLYNAQKQLTKATEEHVQTLSTKWKDAYEQGKISAVEMYRQTYQEAVKYYQQLITSGEEGPEAAKKTDAALKVVQQTLHDLQVVTLKETNDAFHALGVNSQTEFENMRKKADEEFQRIATSGDANAFVVQEAWVNKTQAAYQDILKQGGQLTQDQKSELDRQKQQVQDHLDQLPSQWKTAYDGVKAAVGGAVDDMIGKLVKGDFSFGDTAKKMLEDIGSTALHTFIDPFKDAVSKFVANELADLLSGKGLGGVLDGLKSIGSAVTGIFGGGGGGVGGIAGAAGSIPGVGGGGGGAMGGIAGAAGSSITGIVGAVGSIGTMVSSIIGNFQQAKMETTMNAVEHNTRYSALYLGDRADGGILGVLFKIDEEIAWGANTKAVENLRDLFKDWSGPMLSKTSGIYDQVIGQGPYIVDIKTAVQELDAVAQSIAQSATDPAARGINVSVNATGVTPETAKVLGDQIANNIAKQMVGSSMR